jgi:hypothetical protein
MQGTLKIAFLALALAAVAGCAGLWNVQPTGLAAPKPEEMRQALRTMMKEQPDILIPEFQDSMARDDPVVKDGLIHIGPWECDPKLNTFEALFTSSDVTMYEVSGRFHIDARGIWLATPYHIVKTLRHDIGEYWRASEIDPR